MNNNKPSISTQKKLFINTTIVASVVTGIIACGGGGGGGTTPDDNGTPPPTATGFAALYNDATANLPSGLAGLCMDAEAGDYDGDGDIDLVLAIEFGRNKYLENNGSATFTSVDAFPFVSHDSEDLAVADFDNDGDLDVLFVSEDDIVDELYLNDGSANFTDVSNRIPVNAVSNAVTVIDYNNDGALDILIGNAGGNQLFENDGSANFTDVSANVFVGDGTTQDIEVADVDNDGDMDILVGNESLNRIFINNGDATFTEESATRFPGIEAETRDLEVGDIDNDGDLDLLVSNVGFFGSFDDLNYLLINDGVGNFSMASLPMLSGNHVDSDLIDLDRDGDLDIITGTASLSDSQGVNRALRNDGTGTFEFDSFNGRGNLFDITAADFNGDGKVDLYFCNREAVFAPTGFEGGQDMLYLAN